MKNIDTLRCESFLALTKDSELFIKSVKNIFTNGRNSGNSLSNVRRDFANFTCMDSYWNWADITRLRDDFYFGFFLQPDWVENVVDEFNSKFNNFSIEIIYKKDWNIFAEKDWGRYEYFYSNTSSKDIHSKAGGYIFKLNIRIELKPNIKRKILYIFHHFLRSISVSEHICQFSDPPPYTNFIEYVLNKSNIAPGGRALTDYFVTEEDFLALDDKEVLESFDYLIYGGIMKQSDILYIVGQLKKYGKKYFDEIPWERGGMPNNPKTLYGIFISEPGGFVYIKRKSNGKIIYNSLSYVNQETLFRAKARIEYAQNRVSFLNTYNEGGLRTYQLFPLVELYNRFPELDEEIMPKLVELINKTFGGKFKTPEQKDLITE